MKVAVSVSKKKTANYTSEGIQIGISDIEVQTQTSALAVIRTYHRLLDSLAEELMSR